jgi:CRISPR-associated exonuclease Cas4
VKSEYTQDDLLPLSGIQHFLFCRRQWALIHIEQQWKENALTAEGRIMHKRADDPFLTETRNGVITTRSVPVASYRLGLSGVCDVVEFTASLNGIKLPNRDGLYLAAPVEYKHGKEKYDHSDETQLCAQAMCLEEMLSFAIPKGYLYYGETRHRVEIELTAELRTLVKNMSDEMHNYFSRGYTPHVKPFKGCHCCSMADICLPELQGKVTTASKYIMKQIEDA